MEWYIHPNALLLSVNANMCGCCVVWLSASKESWIVMIAAMNSRRFMDAR